MVAKVSTFDRFGKKRVVGGERGGGEFSLKEDKSLEGEKRKVFSNEGEKSYEGKESGFVEGFRKIGGYAQAVRGAVSGGVKGGSSAVRGF